METDAIKKLLGLAVEARHSLDSKLHVTLVSDLSRYVAAALAELSALEQRVAELEAAVAVKDARIAELEATASAKEQGLPRIDGWLDGAGEADGPLRCPPSHRSPQFDLETKIAEAEVRNGKLV